MAFKLITDSCCDLPEKYINDNGLTVIPLMFTLDGNEYSDGSMDPKEFYSRVRRGSMPTTTLINTQRYLDEFTKILEEGDDFIYIAFSSALSGSYQCSVAAIEQLAKDYPNRRIAAIDSKCASMGQGLLVYHTVEKQKEGLGFDELVKFINETWPKVCHWFTVDDLNHLKRGGRLSATSAILGTLLSIKPVLHVDDNGKLIPMSKARGRKKSLAELVDAMKKSIKNPDGQMVMISHGDAGDEANEVAAMVREAFPGIRDIMINNVGTVIGAHSGPGTMALFYLGEPR